LQSPGLHYDEAKEAGLNAMQLATGQPVTAFRDAAVQFGPRRLPLMVQDYIGSLNVLLAIPFLAIGGVNVIALRWLPLLTGALTLLLTWRVAYRLGGPVAAGITALLLAVNPSFIFWSRQGIFVTNLTALIFIASLLTGLRWWANRRPADLWLTAFLWGLGIYAKLLFVWAIGAMVAAAGIASLLRTQSQKPETENWKLKTENWKLISAVVFFLLPLVPLVLFNLRTGGTLTSIFGNLGRSYYGVNNAAYLPNLLTRFGQVRTLLRGDHFWYLGGVFANEWAPWIATGLVVAGLGAWVCGRMGEWANGRMGEWANGRMGEWANQRITHHAPRTTRHVTIAPFLPIALFLFIIAQSAFTVSDLFITHFVLLLPLIPLAGGLAAGSLMQNAKYRMQKSTAFILLTSAFLLSWAGGDLWTTVRYHRALAATGGHAGHSDAVADLAAYLERGGLWAPVTLDWGMDASVRFLTAGRVNPIEVFGYARLDAADDGFAARVSNFLDNPDNVYLAHTPEATVFRGRVEAVSRLAAERGLALREEIRFNERSGRPLFVVYRIGRK
jgi:hypothetical protein